MANRQVEDSTPSNSLMGHWPFLIAYDCSKFNQLWATHPLAPSGNGFARHQLGFQIETSRQSAFFASCSLGPLHLQTVADGDGGGRLQVRRPFLDGVHINLRQDIGFPLRLITEVRRITQAQGIELALGINLATSLGRYDDKGGVSLGWGVQPEFTLSGADGAPPDGLDALPYQLFFTGLPDTEKDIELGVLNPVSDTVLKPLQFQLRYTDASQQTLVLHPRLAGEDGRVFPAAYLPWKGMESGVGMILDGAYYPSLAMQDIDACPALLMPADAVGCVDLQRQLLIFVYGIFAAQARVPAQATTSQGYSLEPMVRVVNVSQEVALHLLPERPGIVPRDWSLDGSGTLAPDGWRCTFRPDGWGKAASQGEAEGRGIVPHDLSKLCEFNMVTVTADSAVHSATIVVLRGAPTGWIRVELHSERVFEIHLCYTDNNGEEAHVSLDDMFADGVNCAVISGGHFERVKDKPFCIVRAYDHHGGTGVWGVLVLPVPLLDGQTALGLGIG